MKQRLFLVLAHRSLLQRNENYLSYKWLTHSIDGRASDHGLLVISSILCFLGKYSSAPLVSERERVTCSLPGLAAGQLQIMKSLAHNSTTATVWILKSMMPMSTSQQCAWEFIISSSDQHSAGPMNGGALHMYAAGTILRSRLGPSILVLAPIKTVSMRRWWSMGLEYMLQIVII